MNPIALRTLAFAFAEVDDRCTQLRIDDCIAKSKSKLFNEETGQYETGTEITSKDFLQQLDAVATPEILVIINSGGGDVTEGSVIANAIRRKRGDGTNITCRIDGLCASAAVDIACACSHAAIYQNAYMMIHEARTCYWFVDRSASELRADAEMLDTMNDGVAQNYADKCGKPKAEVLQLMAQTKWFNGQQAVDFGFADELLLGEAEPSATHSQKLFLLNDNDLTKAPPALQVLLSKQTKGEQRNMEIKTVAEMQEAYPELCRQMEETAVQTAITGERARMKELDEVAGQIPAQMMMEAKYEKNLDAKTVVFQALKENRLTGGSAVLAALKADSAPASAVPATANGGVAGMTEQQKEAANAKLLAETAAKLM